MKNKEKFKLTQEYLKEALTYDPDTGIFTWNERPVWHFRDGKKHTKEVVCKFVNSNFANKIASTKMNKGYTTININGHIYLSHRLAFLYMDGYMPEYEVDHVNRIRDDNRWCNLRHVSTLCNSQNKRILDSNTSGVTGVCWDKATNKWVAQIKTSDGHKKIGRYETFEHAVMARYNEELNNPLWTCSVESSAYQYLKENNLIDICNNINFKKCRLQSNNKSMVTGVHWNKRSKKWRAGITIHKKLIYLGGFKEFEDAVKARYNEELNNKDWVFDEDSTAYNYLKDHNLLQ